MKRWDGAAYQDLASAKRWDGVAYQDLTIAKKWDGVAWQDIALPGGGGGGLSLTTDAPGAFGSVFDNEPAPLTAFVSSSAITGTAVGGVGAGPTYAWTRKSGSSAISAASPSSATTVFTGNVSKNGFRTAVFTLTATRGVDSVAVDVDVELEYYTDL